MNQQITSQQHHMTSSTSGGGMNVVQQTYQVQQKHESYQQQYSGQQPIRMQQQYQVSQQQSPHQGHGQPGQQQRIFQDSSSVKSQEYITKGQQPLQRGPQQPQQQNPAFGNQFPGQQQFHQPSQQQFQQPSQQQYQQPSQQQFQQPFQQQFQQPSQQQFQQPSQQQYNQPQLLSQQQTPQYSQQQVNPSSMDQLEDDFLKKPTKKISQWPPPQQQPERPKQEYQPGSKGLASWPPPQDSDESNQAKFEPNKLGQIYTEMPDQPYQSQQPMKNIQKLDAHAYAPHNPQQSQAVPQQISGHPQNQQAHGVPKGTFGSPNVGNMNHGANNPQRMDAKTGFNATPGFVPNLSSPQGRGQVSNPLQAAGLGQNSNNPQGAGFVSGLNNPQRPGYGQMPNNPHTVNGQGPQKQHNPIPSQGHKPQATPPFADMQAAAQPQQNPEGPQRYEPLVLPRGTIQDQKTYFEKPHQYDPSQCDVGVPYGDGNLPEWPPKNAGGPNMTMTYPSAFKLRDEAPIDHQTLPLAAPSQPAFKLTTPIKKKGDEVWPPKGAFDPDDPSTDVREFSRPTKANKAYDSFFAANMLPNNYPGYRAPPGTQHVGFMEDAQPL